MVGNNAYYSTALLPYYQTKLLSGAYKRGVYCLPGGKKSKKPSAILLATLLFFLIFGTLVPAVPLAAGTDMLEILGDGVQNPITLTREQLEGMEQHQEVYSSINTWPTKKWYAGEGVRLWDLLQHAGIKKEAKLIKFTSADSYTVTLTVKELFQDKRYRFPHFMENADADGHLPGLATGAVPVEPIIALLSVEGSDDPGYMNKLNTLLLMLGQRAVTEQVGNLFVKYLCKIEVSTAEPEKWDEPQANPGSGSVPKGTMVTLSNLHCDDDKIYYTLDGSVPDMNSSMYNWIASRWWPSRADILGKINRPIGPINGDTIIKAITIGPGKKDSNVVTFSYHAAAKPGESQKPAGDGELPTQPIMKVIKLIIDRKEASVNGEPYELEAAPYLNQEVGRVLVPLRFVSETLGATVEWNPETQQITIAGEGREVILTLGSREASVNGLAVALDCIPRLRVGRTLVPLRFVSENMGAKVDYRDGMIIIAK
jgi:hypothetical protein